MIYQNVKLDAVYRIDILVDNTVIVEIKSVDAFASINNAQELTYLKLSGKKLGLLINFNLLNLQE